MPREPEKTGKTPRKKTKSIRKTGQPVKKTRKSTPSTRKTKTEETPPKTEKPQTIPTGRYIPPPEEDPYDHLPPPDPKEKYMAVGDHLEELRWRIIGILGAMIVLSVFAGIFSKHIHIFLSAPYREATTLLPSFSGTKTGEGLPFILNSVYGTLDVLIRLSLMVGFSLSLPLGFYLFWGFITPALSRRLSMIGHSVIACSCLLFWLGMLVCWKFIFPLSLQFLLREFTSDDLFIVPVMTVEKYYSFLFSLHIAAGILFQLPLLLTTLGILNILTLDWHKRTWKHFIVGVLILSAVITPPDPLSQVLFALPLLLLYGASLVTIWIFTRKRSH